MFHFTGHGRFDETSRQGQLAFEDERRLARYISPQRFYASLHPATKLVVLNACETARGFDRLSNIAHSLAMQKIPAVVAMQFRILDTASNRFSKIFYMLLARGTAVDEAVADARREIYKTAEDQDCLDWAAPILYISLSSVFSFKIDQQEKLLQQKRLEEERKQLEEEKRERERLEEEKRERERLEEKRKQLEEEKRGRARLEEEKKRLEEEKRERERLEEEKKWLEEERKRLEEERKRLEEEKRERARLEEERKRLEEEKRERARLEEERKRLEEEKRERVRLEEERQRLEVVTKELERLEEEKQKKLEEQYNNAFFSCKEGNTLCRLERYQEALKAYEEAVRLDPNYVDAYNGMGDALCRLERYQEALEAYEEVVRLDPNYVAAYYGMGRALLKLEYYHESEEAYQRAADLSIEPPGRW